MLWVKSVHIMFVVAWFAGLFYLPRLFVYHTQCAGEEFRAQERFKTMERKLLGIMNLAALVALASGLWLLHWFSFALRGAGWLHAKLLLVVLLVAFHGWCWKLVGDFRADRNTHGERFYRIINEIPALLLIAIVLLVVVKPF